MNKILAKYCETRCAKDKMWSLPNHYDACCECPFQNKLLSVPCASLPDDVYLKDSELIETIGNFFPDGTPTHDEDKEDDVRDMAATIKELGGEKE